MKDVHCLAFLRWALPRMGLRWAGFRRMRAQVCKRIERRRKALGLPDIEAYREYLGSHLEEWPVLDGLCRVTVSRFYRDAELFERLGRQILPALADAAQAAGRDRLRCWSAGCGSGEEPYGLCLVWHLAVSAAPPAPELEVVGTDTDPVLLRRAERGCYGAGSLRELPRHWIARAFRRSGDEYCLAGRFREGVAYRLEDIRCSAPEGLFDLILCRNLAFTYFDASVQRQVLTRLLAHLREGGVLALGVRERPPKDGPEDGKDLCSLDTRLGLYRRGAGGLLLGALGLWVIHRYAPVMMFLDVTLG